MPDLTQLNPTQPVPNCAAEPEEVEQLTPEEEEEKEQLLSEVGCCLESILARQDLAWFLLCHCSKRSDAYTFRPKTRRQTPCGLLSAVPCWMSNW